MGEWGALSKSVAAVPTDEQKSTVKPYPVVRSTNHNESAVLVQFLKARLNT